ncbi:MAG: Na/Pi cotransporter family protein [Lachnospiraceae bacterium]|nr:Na/Pi cotransporter family protein [Lachnospiraceae bacterium]
MDIFDIISMFGGLAMFLYGMRLMGNGLKEGSSGALKRAMERVTNNHIKSFVLGLGITAVIQSSNATIVITSGLIAAGILTLEQSLGIVIGANLGTTVTGQIVRLLGVEGDGFSVLRFFQPSTLAPLALIFGILLILTGKRKNSEMAGNILLGFGILFTGLMGMTEAVDSISETGIFETLFSTFSDKPALGYLTGVLMSCILQSASASIAILQAFSMSGSMTFSSVYLVLLGIFIGAALTTMLVCSFSSTPDSKRVGMVHMIFNIGKTVVVVALVLILGKAGVLSRLVPHVMSPGSIANINTVFNLVCAVVLFPALNAMKNLSRKIIKDAPAEVSPAAALLDSLSPTFFDTPALALRSCYDLMNRIYDMSVASYRTSMNLLKKYNEEDFKKIYDDEHTIDMLTDATSKYLMQLSPYLKTDNELRIFEEYEKVLPEFERLGDHAMNLAEFAQKLAAGDGAFSATGYAELDVLSQLINEVLSKTGRAFKNRDIAAAREIEPLEEVVDDMVGVINSNHFDRLRTGESSLYAGMIFLDVLIDIERMSDSCSNVGLSIISRVEVKGIQPHEYSHELHHSSEWFNERHMRYHEEYFEKLEQAREKAAAAPAPADADKK